MPSEAVCIYTHTCALALAHFFMAKTKDIKNKEIEAIVSSFSNAGLKVLFSFSGITVSQIEDLRRKFKEKGLNFQVVKKTLLLIALGKLGFEESKVKEIVSQLEQTSALGCGGDEVTQAKVLFEFMKNNPQVSAKTGFLDAALFSPDELKQLSKIPGRQELYGQVAGIFVNTLRGMLNVLNGPQRQLVNLLNNYINK